MTDHPTWPIGNTIIACPNCGARVINVHDFAGLTHLLDARDDEMPGAIAYHGHHPFHVCPTT